MSETPARGSLRYNPQYDIIPGFNRSEGDKRGLAGIDENACAPGNELLSSNQLSYNAGIGVFTAHVHGGDDLQIQFMATAAFTPNLNVIR